MPDEPIKVQGFKPCAFCNGTGQFQFETIICAHCKGPLCPVSFSMPGPWPTRTGYKCRTEGCPGHAEEVIVETPWEPKPLEDLLKPIT